jgi:hypothetical protein
MRATRTCRGTFLIPRTARSHGADTRTMALLPGYVKRGAEAAARRHVQLPQYPTIYRYDTAKSTDQSDQMTQLHTTANALYSLSPPVTLPAAWVSTASRAQRNRARSSSALLGREEHEPPDLRDTFRRQTGQLVVRTIRTQPRNVSLTRSFPATSVR